MKNVDVVKKATGILMPVLGIIGLFFLTTNISLIWEYYFTPVIPSNIAYWSEGVSGALFIIGSVYLLSDSQKFGYFRLVVYTTALIVLIILFACTGSWLLDKLSANTVVGHNFNYYYKLYTLVFAVIFGLSWSFTANQEFSKGLIHKANALFMPLMTGLILIPFGTTYGLLVTISLLIFFYSLNKVIYIFYWLYKKKNLQL